VAGGKEGNGEMARAMATMTKRAMVTNSNNMGFTIKKSFAFEDGCVPCGGKTVSTRAHIHKVQRYLRKTTLQAKLCS
jgi:hypothetical protein